MDVDLIYDEETTKNILKYETLLTKYETRLRELIDNTPNLSYSTRQELFNDDRGRKSIIQVITKYETRLRELIDKTPNLDYSTRQELFNDDRGRKSIIQVITNLKRTFPEDIFIVGENLLIGR